MASSKSSFQAQNSNSYFNVAAFIFFKIILIPLISFTSSCARASMSKDSRYCASGSEGSICFADIADTPEIAVFRHKEVAALWQSHNWCSFTWACGLQVKILTNLARELFAKTKFNLKDTGICIANFRLSITLCVFEITRLDWILCWTASAITRFLFTGILALYDRVRDNKQEDVLFPSDIGTFLDAGLHRCICVAYFSVVHTI